MPGSQNQLESITPSPWMPFTIDTHFFANKQVFNNHVEGCYHLSHKRRYIHHHITGWKTKQTNKKTNKHNVECLHPATSLKMLYFVLFLVRYKCAFFCTFVLFLIPNNMTICNYIINLTIPLMLNIQNSNLLRRVEKVKQTMVTDRNLVCILFLYIAPQSILRAASIPCLTEWSSFDRQLQCSFLWHHKTSLSLLWSWKISVLETTQL